MQNYKMYCEAVRHHLHPFMRGEGLKVDKSSISVSLSFSHSLREETLFHGDIVLIVHEMHVAASKTEITCLVQLPSLISVTSLPVTSMESP